MTNSSPRKIVLLSDGTCNSSVKAQKTNIWRIYNAIPPLPGKNGENTQLAFYDDGVGTSGFRPLMLLGAVFGWGLSRNVYQLYEDLCRHYRPGDKIYIFGFSRGAYTARILIDVIQKVGIVDASKTIPAWPYRVLDNSVKAEKRIALQKEGGLRKAVKTAFKSYRREKWRSKWIPFFYSSIFRQFREHILRINVPRMHEFKANFCHPVSEVNPPIEFAGCFDTVDALGLPIDELAIIWDELVFPYKFNDEKLSPIVKKAAHAIAIDDERHTFHPVLWDHSAAGSERITQVWFTGMHANVGGGYPEDQLSHVPLCWMMDQIDQRLVGSDGLTFDPVSISAFQTSRNYNGLIHNSRRGAGVMYRFKPRNIHKIWRDVAKEKPSNARKTVIHHAVLDRLIDRNAGYAPAGIPDEFLVADKTGISVPTIGSKYYLTPQQHEKRGSFLSWAEDFIAWGRLAYFIMLSSFLYLLAFPFIEQLVDMQPFSDAEIQRLFKIPIDKLGEIVASIGIDFSIGHLNVMGSWIESWKSGAPHFYGGILAFLFSFLAGLYFKMKCKFHADDGWADLKKMPRINPAANKGIFAKTANWVRTSPTFQLIRRKLLKELLPRIFIASLILILLFIFGVDRLGSNE